MQTTPKRRVRRIPATALIFLLITISFGSCIALITAIDFATAYFGENKRPVPGDSGQFDPIAAFPEIRLYAGENAQLNSIQIDFARADGTLNLKATSYKPRATYTFYRELSTPPADVPPVGAGGSPNQKWFERIDVIVQQADSYNLGLRRSVGRPQNSIDKAIPPPACSLKRLWSAAMERGAPPDAVATIRLSERGYDFSIRDINFGMQFDPACGFMSIRATTAPIAPPTLAPTATRR